MCTGQVGAAQVRRSEVSTLEVGTLEVRAGQVSSRQVCVTEVSIREIRAGEVGAGKVQAVEIGAPETESSTGEVEDNEIWSGPATEHRERGPNIGRRLRKTSQVTIDCHATAMDPARFRAGLTGRRTVEAHEGAQHFDSCRLLVRRVNHQLPQGVDST